MGLHIPLVSPIVLYQTNVCVLIFGIQYIIPEIAIYFVGQFYCMVFSSLTLQQLILSLRILSMHPSLITHTHCVELMK